LSTTLRFASSGEIAVIGNGSLADTRITNLKRTKMSVIMIDLTLNISLHNKENLKEYKGKIDDYISSYPNIWEGVNFFRCENIDTRLGVVYYRLAVRCRVSWQNAKRVYGHKADLHKFCISAAQQLGVESKGA